MLEDLSINGLMKHAMDLAENGRGRVSPNPLVGAVIVNDVGDILAEGWHKEAGDKHAEINAIDSAIALGISDFSDLTLICTLEPCNVWGKTPPCTTAIIQAGFKNIYIGIGDPNPKVNGRGIEILEKAGLNVKVGFIEDLLLQQNAGFIKVMKEARPLITLKLAVSADGYLAGEASTRAKITNLAQDILVHGLRASQDAILVGIGTVRVDNPMLTVRHGVKRSKPLTRIILDPNVSIDPHSELVKTSKEIPTLIIVSEDLIPDHRFLDKFPGELTTVQPKGLTVRSANASDQKIAMLEKCGAKVLAVPVKGPQIDLEVLVAKLADLGICYLMIEGGEAVAASFLRAGLVDRLDLFYGNIAIRGASEKIQGAFEEKPLWPHRSLIDELKLGDVLELQSRRFVLAIKNEHFSQFIV